MTGRLLKFPADLPMNGSEGTATCSGTGPLRVLPGGLEGAELIDGWRLDQRRRGLMPSTIAKRTDMVRTFDRWLPGPIQLATADDIEVFLDSRRNPAGHPISSRTRYTYLSALGCLPPPRRATRRSV